MYSGVPQVVRQTEPDSSSLEYPKSQSLMMGRSVQLSSSTLSSWGADRLGFRDRRAQGLMDASNVLLIFACCVETSN